ncbi:MAG: BamA/TamA family outer membrane protein [Bacteroidales bacterium]
MKIGKKLIEIFLFYLCGFSYSQAQLVQDKNEDTNIITRKIKKPEKIKSGWNLIPLPVIGYNTDLGFQLGAICTVYDFGKPSFYPNYKQKIFFVGSYFSKGSGVFRLTYDSKQIIKNYRLSGELNYIMEPYASFRGYNGYESPSLHKIDSKFYTFNRSQFKAFITFQGEIIPHLNWGVGISYFNYCIQTDLRDTNQSLFNLYKHYKIIKPEEAAGGNILGFNGSITYDTRDIESDPKKGMQAELMVSIAPDFIDQQGHSFAKANLHFRHYIPLYKDKLTLAYHLAYQTTFLGESPYYEQSYLYCIIMNQNFSEGLGGVNSIRGVARNRAVGAGIAWGNVELRYRFGYIRFLNQNWYFVVNPFFDAGMVVRKYRAKEIKESHSSQIYSGQTEYPHCSAGLGFKVIVNSNFVGSLEFGKALDKRDGVYSFSFGLNYIF